MPYTPRHSALSLPQLLPTSLRSRPAHYRRYDRLITVISVIGLVVTVGLSLFLARWFLLPSERDELRLLGARRKSSTSLFAPGSGTVNHSR